MYMRRYGLKELLNIVKMWNEGVREPFTLSFDGDSDGLDVICSDSGRILLTLDHQLRVVEVADGLNELLPLDQIAADLYHKTRQRRWLREDLKKLSDDSIAAALAELRMRELSGKPDPALQIEIEVTEMVQKERQFAALLAYSEKDARLTQELYNTL